jgi:hypothetical protein
MQVKTVGRITKFSGYENECVIMINDLWYTINWGILQIIKKYIPVGTVVTITTEDDGGEILDIEETA